LSKKCQAVTAKGQKCEVWALKGEDFCLFHSNSDRAKEIRKRAWKPSTFITRREIFRQLSKDFRALADRTDEASRKERLKLAGILHQMVNEQAELNRIKRLAREKGLL
jgi:hypothetical protein